MRIEVSVSHDGAHTTARAMEMDALGAGSWAAGTLTPWGLLEMRITPLPAAQPEPEPAPAEVEVPAAVPDPLTEQARAAGLVDESASAELNALIAQQAEEAGATAPEPVVLLTRPQFEAPAPAAEPAAEAVPEAEPEAEPEPETSTDSGAKKPSRR